MNDPVRILINTAILIAIGILSYIGFKSGNHLLMIALAVLPALIISSGKPEFWFIISLATFNSAIRLPGLPGDLKLYQLTSCAFIGLSVLICILHKQKIPLKSYLKVLLITFSALLLMLIYLRGSGFRVLGDSKWGGARYVSLFIGILFVYYSSGVRLSSKQWKFSIIAMTVLAFLPGIAELILILSKGKIIWQYYLLDIEGTTILNVREAAHGSFSRFQMMGPAGTALITLPFVLFPFKGNKKPIYIICILTGFFLIGLSGHRLGMIFNAGFIIVYGLYRNRHRMAQYLTIVGMAGLGVLLLLIILGPYLPLTLQRSLSWVPFIRISDIARIDASSTLTWRYLVWEYALQEVPKFLWLGKGYAFHGNAVSMLDIYIPGFSSVLWASLNVSYHNGPLSLLIGMGLPGLLVGYGLLVAAPWRHIKEMNKPWPDDEMKRMHLVLVALLTLRCLSFTFLYGDTYISFPKIFLLWGMLEAMSNSRQTRMEAPVQTGQSSPLTTRTRIHTAPA